MFDQAIEDVLASARTLVGRTLARALFARGAASLDRRLGGFEERAARTDDDERHGE
jgi:hypothetical protein